MAYEHSEVFLCFAFLLEELKFEGFYSQHKKGKTNKRVFNSIMEDIKNLNKVTTRG